MILKDNDNYMFRFPIFSHLQAVNLGYFNIQLALLLNKRSRLQPEDGLNRKAETCNCHYLLNII